MRVVAIIPARGGSKGIPRKNLLPVSGKPLIAWTIEHGLAVPEVRVIVSTEDPEIADVSRAAGAEVFPRPPELAGDDTASEPVIEHVIATLTERGERPDVVIFLQATSPVRLPGTLARALATFLASDADALLSVVPVSPFLWRPDGRPEYDIARRPRRQDFTAEHLRFRENGSIYITRTEIYETLHNRLGGKIKLFVLDPSEDIDIDDWADAQAAGLRLATMSEQTTPDHAHARSQAGRSDP